MARMVGKVSLYALVFERLSAMGWSNTKAVRIEMEKAAYAAFSVNTYRIGMRCGLCPASRCAMAGDNQNHTYTHLHARIALCYGWSHTLRGQRYLPR